MHYLLVERSIADPAPTDLDFKTKSMDPDPGRQNNGSQKREKRKKFHVLKRWLSQ
jgi:hypothetical protein